jgi:hypothetical protein
VDARCDYCDRPATWHAAWQTPTMSETTIAHACDERRFEGMTPLDQPPGLLLEHLPARVDVGEIDDEREIDNEDDEL